MNTTETMLGSGRPVSAVCADAELADEALAVLEEAEDVPVFLERLREEGLMEDAVAFLAHALPPRQAVGWAWVCAREASGDDAPKEIAESLDVTRAWIKEPSDEVRSLRPTAIT